MALNGETHVPSEGGDGRIESVDDGSGTSVADPTALTFLQGITDDGDGTATIPSPGGSGGPSDERGRQNQVWLYATKSAGFDHSGTISAPSGVAFNSDASKMYLAGGSASTIEEFTLSTPGDVTTASHNQTLDVSGTVSYAGSLTWKPDGTKMYVACPTNQDLYEYTLGTAYDISTASLNYTLDVSTNLGGPLGIEVGWSGNKIYVTDNSNELIAEYFLSPAYDLSSGYFSQSINSPTANPEDVNWSHDGLTMFYVDNSDNTVLRYSASTKFDVTTLTHTGVFDLSAVDTSPESMAWAPDGSKMWVLGGLNKEINEFTA